MDEFSRSRMGQRFFESTLPSFVKAVERIATVMEKTHEAKRWPSPQDPSVGVVSVDAVLSLLAGMSFPGQGEAYDFVKKALKKE